MNESAAIFGAFSNSTSEPNRRYLQQPLKCLIQNTDDSGAAGGRYEAPAPYVEKWQETHPGYVSPYATKARVLQEDRALQTSGGASATKPSSIMIVAPGDAVSFATGVEHFPVYLRNSAFNTNADFDDGVFETLKTKIVDSGIAIASFAFTFSQSGVYVFGDFADPANV